MPKQNESPYVSHVFVCTNDRGGERKSCLPLNVSWQMIEKKTGDTAKIAYQLGQIGRSLRRTCYPMGQGPNS